MKLWRGKKSESACSYPLISSRKGVKCQWNQDFWPTCASGADKTHEENVSGSLYDQGHWEVSLFRRSSQRPSSMPLFHPWRRFKPRIKLSLRNWGNWHLYQAHSLWVIPGTKTLRNRASPDGVERQQMWKSKEKAAACKERYLLEKIP